MKRPAERLFTIRMWRPTAEDARAVPDWRGAVYDVVTRKTLYVVGVREITDCISSALSEPEAGERDGGGG